MANKKAKTKSDDNVIVLDVAQVFLAGLVLLVGAIITGSIFLTYNNLKEQIEDIQSAPAAAAAPAADTYPQEPTGPVLAQTSLDDDDYIGNLDNAKFAIVEFSDYECPFCKRFYDDTLAQLKEEYGDDMIFAYRDLPLSFHPLAQIQAEGAECAGDQGKYYEMHDAIFDQGGKMTADLLKAAAVDIGLNAEEFNDCLDTEKHAEEVNADAADAASIGINGTPGFVVGTVNEDGEVDGEVVSGALPFAQFQTIIEGYL